MSDIEQMSQEIWEDLDEPISPTTASISGWLSVNTSKFNVLVDGCYKVESGNFVPSFCSQESGIYKQMYIIKNLESRIRKGLDGSMYVASGSSAANANWTKLEEGDSKITRASPAEMMKVLKSEKDSAKEDLDDLVHKYNMNKAKPRQVVGEDQAYPNYSFDFRVDTTRNGHQ